MIQKRIEEEEVEIKNKKQHKIIHVIKVDES